MAFLLHFKDDGKKKKKNFFFFVLSNVLYPPTFISHFTFPQTSKCFLSNGIRICKSLLQVLTYRQLDLGMSFQAKMEENGPILSPRKYTSLLISHTLSSISHIIIQILTVSTWWSIAASHQNGLQVRQMRITQTPSEVKIDR